MADGHLLERERELGRLRTLVEAALAGRGCAAVVVGPPGIGKTSLLISAQDQFAVRGVECLYARGGELEQHLPYGVVRRLFEPVLRRMSERERAPLLQGAAAVAAPVLGLAEPEETPAADSAFAVTHGLYWVCVNLAQRGPLALVVDDVHWADPASLRFLAYLQRRVAELPVLVVTAARPPAGTAYAELVEAVTEQTEVHRIVPAPLSLRGVGDLLRARLGAPPGEPDVIRACHQLTSGNPFLCEVLGSALARERARSGRSYQPQRVLQLAGGQASALVVRRLSRLPPGATALARAVAVLGTETELHQAAAVAGLNGREATVAADMLAAREILRTGPPVDFVHPLVRAAVTGRIPAAERSVLHGRAARLLAGQGAAPERIAVHLLTADPAPAAGPEDAWAVQALRRAARTAGRHGDPTAAALCLRRALREPVDPPVRGALLHDLGLAELHAGRPTAAAGSLSAAQPLTAGPLERAAVARDLALALATTGNYAQAVEVLRRALDEVSGRRGDALAAALLEAELHQSAMMEPSQYSDATGRLGRLDPGAVRDPRGERALLATMATEECLRTGRAATARRLSTRAFERGLLDEQARYSSLWSTAALPLIFAGAFTEARRIAERAVEDARRRGSPVATARAFAVRSLLHLHTGALRDAESDARTAIDLGLQAGFQIALIPLGVLVESLVERGDLMAAQAALDRAGGDGRIPERFLHNWVLHARAKLRRAQGRTGDAIADFEELGRRGVQGWRPWNPAMFAYRSGLALALLRSGRRERARAEAGEELELALHWGAPRAVGIAQRTLARIEGGPDGLALLRRSLSVLDGSGAHLERARSLVDYGTALRRLGHRGAACEPLQAGMDLAHQCGAMALTEQARGELVAAGARPGRLVRAGLDALSPSELRVARMAAGGLTDREIAQALFVTPRTVHIHLAHACAKLGVSSRSELSVELSGRAYAASAVVQRP